MYCMHTQSVDLFVLGKEEVMLRVRPNCGGVCTAKHQVACEYLVTSDKDYSYFLLSCVSLSKHQLCREPGSSSSAVEAKGHLWLVPSSCIVLFLFDVGRSVYHVLQYIYIYVYIYVCIYI